ASRFIIPVVENVPEHEHIRPRRKGVLEEVTGVKVYAVSNPVTLHGFQRRLLHLWQVKDRTAQLRVLWQHRGKERPRCSTDIHYMGKRSKVIARRMLPGGAIGGGEHGVHKSAQSFFMLINGFKGTCGI